jgi:uncharacterized protein (DUF305 family)
MAMPMRLLLVAAFMAAAPGLALAQSAQPDAMKGMAMKSAASPADQAFMESMQAMMKNMNVRPTGKPDQDFVLMMMPHQQGAIDMAKVELRYGKDPELLKLAGDIVTAQEKEIAEMKDWLARNGK